MTHPHTLNQPAPLHSPDVIVVGGGLAGLTAAALVARHGRSVTVLEQAGHLGGRAATNLVNDVQFNLGPHALYAQGQACRVLTELQVPFSGHFPNPGRPLVVLGGTSYRIPTGLGSLAASRLLGAGEKLRLARLFATIKKIDTGRLGHTNLRTWIESTAGRGNLASLLAALVRVSTYVDDAERLSAGTALDQLRSALVGNVLYLDGGWQSIMHGLRKVAVDHGATLRTGARVQSVAASAEGVSVRPAGGEVLHGRAAILAVDPKDACRLLELPADAPLARWASRQTPVAAACLDLALDRLPRPGVRFALGLDRPTYYSVHSAAARLGPPGVAVLHAMKYLQGDSDEPPAHVQAELEAFLDHLQPGWRTHVVARRFLPRMTVAHAVSRADEGGLCGRPATRLTERPGVFLAGDWVGPEGMLADAAVASAGEAAERARAATASPAGGARPESVLHVRP